MATSQITQEQLFKKTMRAFHRMGGNSDQGFAVLMLAKAGDPEAIEVIEGLTGVVFENARPVGEARNSVVEKKVVIQRLVSALQEDDSAAAQAEAMRQAGEIISVGVTTIALLTQAAGRA